MRSRIALAAASMVFAALPAFAGPWTNPTGSLPGVFDYWNGGDVNGLYGDPTLAYNATTKELTLTFIPNDFEASSTDGVGDPVQTTDTLMVDIMITGPALQLNGFKVTEGGSYAITGAGGTVLNESDFVVTNLSGVDPLNPVLGASDTYPLAYQVDTPIAGYWLSETGNIDASGRPNYFRVELSNLLSATSNVGGTASISKLGSQIEVTLIIPEPGTLGLLSLSLLAVFRRR